MAHDPPLRTPPAGTSGTLGTFAGVFTPSVLTILGIILFLRLGFVVGSAGLGRALIIIALANAISVLTSVSLSAIATNIKVKGGGDYYLISRTLGVEFGGAIGIVLFLAQSVSVAFYCIGFAEAATGMLDGHPAYFAQIIAALAVSFLFVFAWLGADWATRFQYVVMAALAAALISFFWGGIGRWDGANLSLNWAPTGSGLDFWVLFAIFFPAVTGFTQGVSMSGDLRDPGRSLPLGTFLAVGISILVYFGVALVFAAAMPAEDLVGDYAAMKRTARISFLIDGGVIAATLSSAMASFLGAPRILQSLAGDRIFPFLLPFSRGYGPMNNPRLGVLLTTGIAFATIALGNLNLIAPVVSMFFLVSYGLLNYATYYEARAASPSFRPRFRWFDRRLSLLGWIACLGVILAINLTAGAVAVAVLFALYQYLKRTAGPARWADSRRSFHLQLLREHLLAASAEAEHPRDWRPLLLAFSDNPRRRKRLLRFASWLEGGSGITTAVRLLEGQGVKVGKLKDEAEDELRKDIKEDDLKTYSLVVTAREAESGIETLIQSFGIGPLRANTILLNWIEAPSAGIAGLKEKRFSRNLKGTYRLGLNLVILKADEEAWSALEARAPGERRIDVWWWDDATSRLMLLLAHLITRNDPWEEAEIRVSAAARGKGAEEAEKELRRTLDEVRIRAEPRIMDRVAADVIASHSSDAALVFLPFRIRGDQLVGPLEEPLAELLSRLPVTALVLAAEDLALDAEPEEGKAGELALALDAYDEARKRAEEEERVAGERALEAEQRIRDMASAVSDGAGEELMERVKAALEAKDQATRAARRAAKALAKAMDAARAAEALGAELPGEEDLPEPAEKKEPTPEA